LLRAKPLARFRVTEGTAPLNREIEVLDQFGSWKLHLTWPVWFCDTTGKESS